jgi:predicted CXXCH cytochrome family protein
MVIVSAGLSGAWLARPARGLPQDAQPADQPEAESPEPDLRVTFPRLYASQPDVEKPTGPVEPKDCVTAECHPGVKETPFLHGPVAVNACYACHTVVSEEEHTYEAAREDADLCVFCHEMNLEDEHMIHEPVEKRECIKCHQPHGSWDQRFLKEDSLAALCISCHEDAIGTGSHLHGPVAAGACLACHKAHASPEPMLLSATGAEVCTSCHLTVRDEIQHARYPHDPAQRDCQACHEPHSSDHETMLRQETQELCLDCHEIIRYTMDTAERKHEALTGDGTCLNCHSSHGSNYPRILRDKTMGLCLECHDQEVEMPDKSVLENIGQVISANPSKHGPVADAECTPCHQIHGSNNFRLLTHEYPSRFYAPFEPETYALCFSCHDSLLLSTPRTTNLTDFRNGDENLHFLHVNRGKKGRTCRTCHETHASSNPRHIRDEIPFGPSGWTLPVGFVKTDNGGSCLPGCHQSLDYNRVDPVEYPPRENPAVDFPEMLRDMTPETPAADADEPPTDTPAQGEPR